MAGLTHQQAKRFTNASTDFGLRPPDQAALDAHLTQCANCRAYAQELTGLNSAIGRALRAKWSAPRRSPIDITAKVRQRLRTQAERQLVVGAANVIVRVGSLAVVMVLALGILRGQRVSQNNLTAANPASNLRSGLPSFELEADYGSAAPAYLQSNVSKADNWELPALPLNRLRALQY